MNSKPIPWSLRALVVVVTAFVWVADAHSAPFFKPHLPDFYQHQKSGPKVNVEDDDKIDFSNPTPRPNTVPSYDLATEWWENGGGWCCVAAFVSPFYYLEKQFGYDGLFTRTGGEAKTWQEQMVFATEDFAVNLIPDGTETIARHVRRLEAESEKKIEGQGRKAIWPLSFSEFFLSSGKVTKRADDGEGKPLADVDASATCGSLFDVYHAELCRHQDVTIRLAFFQLVDPTDITKGFVFQNFLLAGNTWWRSSFHVVTGAGVEDCDDKTKRTLYFADPDKRNDLASGAYIDKDARRPYPAGAAAPLPVGQVHYEKVTVDANGEITDGLYKGARIVRVFSVSPIPDISAMT
jgi:hypothetical protein